MFRNFVLMAGGFVAKRGRRDTAGSPSKVHPVTKGFNCVHENKEEPKSKAHPSEGGRCCAYCLYLRGVRVGARV